jgi:hypothetical protein
VKEIRVHYINPIEYRSSITADADEMKGEKRKEQLQKGA